MRDRLHQSHIGVQNVFEDVLGISRGRYAEHFEPGILFFDLPAQVLEHINRVLNWIAVRELIGLAENVAVLVEQYGLGRSRSAVNANKSAYGRAALKYGRYKLLPFVSFLEDVEL